MKVAVLMTCFNRVETTLSCLAHLFRAAEGFDVSVYLNDDASTDGTGDRVKTAYPSVHVIRGSGHGYWCGGMRRAWNAAIASGVAYDGYLWLNDDTYLCVDAFHVLFSSPYLRDALLVGATRSPNENRTTYAGRNAAQQLINPSGRWDPVYTINGNFVWIPQSVFRVLGNFPAYFTHALGDFDYGYRAYENGIGMYQMPSYAGVCDDRKKTVPWMDASVPFVRRLENLYSPIGGPEPFVFFRYNLHHFGAAKAMRIWVQQHIHVCFPRCWTFWKRGVRSKVVKG